MKFPRTDYLYEKSRTTLPANHLIKPDGVTAHLMPTAVPQHSECLSQCRVQSALAHKLRFCDQLGPGGQQMGSASLACDPSAC